MSVLGQKVDDNIYIRKGKLISEQKINSSLGGLDFTGYRLEVIDVSVSRDENNHRLLPQRAFRIVVVSARPLPKMELYSIWFGDLNQLAAYPTQPNELSAVIFAKTLPSDDLTIGLSKRGERSPSARVMFPGNLYVPPDYATPADELETASPTIRLTRLPRTIELIVEYSRGGCFDAMTNWPRYSTIEIEGFEIPRRIIFMCGGDGNDFVGHFSPEEFARIPNGANIIKVVVNGTNLRREVIGRLDKGTIQ